jgi:DNA-binding XRE family transcriptional regulator
MNKAKREALQTAGFQLGTVQDFLGLTDWENQFVQLKYNLRKIVKRRREAQNLTQHDVARRIKSSQSRVAKIEAGAEDTSLDLLFRCLFAVGGDLRELIAESHEAPPNSAPARPARKPTRKVTIASGKDSEDVK